MLKMIQKVKLTQGQILTKDNIITHLNRARNGYDYCRFDMKHGTYITIAFFRDGSVDLMTNNRSLSLWTDISNARKLRSTSALADLVFRWIQVYNK